jgi:hypothetical protein
MNVSTRLYHKVLSLFVKRTYNKNYIWTVFDRIPLPYLYIVMHGDVNHGVDAVSTLRPFP